MNTWPTLFLAPFHQEEHLLRKQRPWVEWRRAASSRTVYFSIVELLHVIQLVTRVALHMYRTCHV